MTAAYQTIQRPDGPITAAVLVELLHQLGERPPVHKPRRRLRSRRAKGGTR